MISYNDNNAIPKWIDLKYGDFLFFNKIFKIYHMNECKIKRIPLSIADSLIHLFFFKYIYLKKMSESKILQWEEAFCDAFIHMLRYKPKKQINFEKIIIILK